MSTLRTSTRRVLLVAAGVAVVGLAFTAGVVAGAGSSPPPRAAGPLDEAAGQIAARALRPVGRTDLEAAAVEAMLRVSGDPWGRWQSTTPVVAGPQAHAGVVLSRLPAGGRSVAQIAVPAFRQGVGREVRAALARLHDGLTAGVVLDLRGDPGGRLDEAVETASAFLDSGPVVSYTRRNGPPQRLDVLSPGDVTTPLVVLVDGGTASAAEVVAGALQDRGRAVLVGSRTFGKGTVQEPQQLSDGSSLALTVARYSTPSGRAVDGVGLQPDIAVAAGTGPDAAVRRAVEVLTGLLADAGGS